MFRLELSIRYNFSFKDGDLKSSIYKNGTRIARMKSVPEEEKNLFFVLIKSAFKTKFFYSRGCMLPINDEGGEVTKALIGFWFYNDKKNYLMPFHLFEADQEYIECFKGVMDAHLILDTENNVNSTGTPSILFDPKESEFKKRIVNLKNSKIQSDVVDDIIDFVNQKGNRSYCLPES